MSELANGPEELELLALPSLDQLEADYLHSSEFAILQVNMLFAFDHFNPSRFLFDPIIEIFETFFVTNLSSFNTVNI